jgi:cerevisin
MASPHTAGLLAYLLSIYPSKSFDPDVSAFVPLPVVQSVPQRAIGTIFSFARAALPAWMSSMLPPPVLDAAAPLPLPTLTPAQLKRALIALATPDILTVIPPKTPNLLIFNNATGL